MAERKTKTPAEDTSLITKDDEPGEEECLASGGVVDIFHPSRAGYLAQYFAVGLMSSGMPATIYGFFIGYLNVPAYVYATAGVITSIPWSFKFLFGMINDCFPIFGRRRKPYMCIGWSFCCVMLVLLSMQTLPEPYWCRDEDGEYITTVTSADGKNTAAEPCNEEASRQGGRFAFFMMLASLGYVIADVAADGLTVEYARREPTSKRGRTQTTAYLTRTLGQIAAVSVVGIGMNRKEYNGSFEWGLTFSQVMLVLAVPAGLMVPVSWYGIEETPKPAVGLKPYLKLCGKLLQRKAFFYVMLFQFLSNLIASITTTAGGLVKNYWAGVQNLQNQLFSLVGSALFAFGLWLVNKYLLNYSWRAMLFSTTVLLNVMDMPFTFLTVYNIVRNQYFYLGETVLYEVPSAANFVVATFIIVEMADEGNEGMVYGLLTTTANLGEPFGNAISNQLFGLFRPALSDSANYIEDTGRFRQVVALSFVVSYFFSFLSLLALPLLPSQKAEAQRRKRDWSENEGYMWFTIVLLSVCLAYSLTVNFLSLNESTMCLQIAGGEGCEDEVPGGSLLQVAAAASNVAAAAAGR